MTVAKASGMNSDRSGEGVVYHDDDEQPRKDQQREHARHQSLSAQVLGSEEQRKADGQDGAAEKHHPKHPRDNAGRHDEPGAAGLREQVELVKNLRQQDTVPRIARREFQSGFVKLAQRVPGDLLAPPRSIAGQSSVIAA